MADDTDRQADQFPGLTEAEVEALARRYWLAEQEEHDDDDRPPNYDSQYDWNP